MDMSTDGDLTNSSGSDNDPDEFDSVVLDDAFIRGGVPEASLRRYQVVREIGAPPPVRPPPVRPPAPPTAPPRPTESTDWPGSGPRHGVRPAGWLLGAGVLLIVLVVLTGLLQLGTGTTSRANLPVAAQLGTGAGAANASAGLGADINPGSCFNITGYDAASASAAVVACTQSHRYELVAVEQAVGTSSYPAQSYWSMTVDQQCAQDLATYSGRAPQQWPDGVHSAFFAPSAADWSAGVRAVYCVAESRPAQTSSMRPAGG